MRRRSVQVAATGGDLVVTVLIHEMRHPIESARAANGLSLAKATALVGIPVLVLLGVVGAMVLV